MIATALHGVETLAIVRAAFPDAWVRQISDSTFGISGDQSDGSPYATTFAVQMNALEIAGLISRLQSVVKERAVVAELRAARETIARFEDAERDLADLSLRRTITNDVSRAYSNARLIVLTALKGFRQK